VCETRPATRSVAALSTLIAMLMACSQDSTAQLPTPNAALPLPPITDEVREQRGSIARVEPVLGQSAPLADARATQYRVVYRSTSGINGSKRDVSGAIFVPPGAPPGGGWPVIAYGHGTTGIGNECGPSQYPNLLGYDLVVASLLELGFVVSLPDYEGLGQPGTHPYLEPRTAAFNMIDSVRAARQVVPESSSRWLAVGIEQGGQASWAANELAEEYGDGLDFLGSASLRPAADLANLPVLAESKWLTKAQQALLPTFVYGLRATNPDLNPGDYLHGTLARRGERWLACSGPLVAELPKAIGELAIDDSEPVSSEATEALRQALMQYALPQRPATGPMLVITGGDDEIVRSQWVASAVEKACALGDVVEFIVRPGEKQSNLDGGPRIAQWVSERLAGAPPANTCRT
jgi:hypothetical protein